VSREGSRDGVASAKASKSSFGVWPQIGPHPRCGLNHAFPLPPPTIARPSESSATLEDVEFMMLSIAAQVSVCGSMVVQP
jgi:hypothetical protein